MITKPPVILLAGGNNSRFFPLNTGTHKGCRLVGGKPLMVWALEDLIKHGYQKVYVVVSDRDYQGKGISGVLAESSLPIEIEYILQPEAKGQADAILKAAKQVTENCIVASPYYINLGELAEQLAMASASSQADCIFLASNTDNPQLFGILSVEGNKVTGVTEKPQHPQSNKKLSSVYFLKNNFLEYLASVPENQYSLEIAFDGYAKEHLIEWQAMQEQPSLKFPWQLLEFMELILNLQTSHVSASANIAKTAILDESTGPIVIDDNADIRDFAIISGPAYIGKNTLVGEYSFVRQSSIEKNVIVGSRTEIARSLIQPGTTIHYGYCADSIIGANNQLSGGLLTANKRLDNQPISVSFENHKQSTGRSKLGIITGDDVILGISTSTMPGVSIGANSTIFPGQTIYESVPPNSSSKPTQTK